MNLNELKNEKVKITIAGDEVEVKAGDPVKDTLTRLLQEKGIDSFTILVDGDEVEVKASEPVKDTLTRILQEKGIDSFTILVDGEEVTSTNDLPAAFAGHEIEVQRYVKAG